MRTSVKWINDYLDPIATADEQADALTRAGLPFDGRETIDGDISQEIETTSNRGDCLCHVGMAREVAAMTGRRVTPPEARPEALGPPIGEIVEVVNQEPIRCPLYSARVILGAKVGPSPEWLAARLRAIGQIPRNNVVDATNFVLFELGQPTHVFDLSLLRGRKIVVRMAHPKEPFLPIGEGAAEVALGAEDLVIADQERAVAIAGVKGGALTAVGESTTDLLLEAATFDPVSVRRTSQRLRIASDSSYRFERGVHPAAVDAAAERLAQIILEIAGGTLCQGALHAGAPLPASRVLTLRVKRCRAILGVALPIEKMMQALETLGFGPQLVRDPEERIHVIVPPSRVDVTREIDLIEEIGRMAGLDTLPIAETIAIRVTPVEPRVAARRALRDCLAGLGYIECTTHSLISEAMAEPFVPAGAAAIRVGDERARAEPILRPSIIPSLLRVRAHNHANGVAPLALFELASIFHARPDGHLEEESLALVMDEVPNQGLRPIRGVAERLLRLLRGQNLTIDLMTSSEVPPSARRGRAPAGWLSPDAVIAAEGQFVGRLGYLHASVQKLFGADERVLVAELYLHRLLEKFPPEVVAAALPEFPAIDRDISAIVDESVSWRQVRATITALELPALEQIDFVTVFRGKPIASGRKSLTARLRFRSGERTLRHEEVDPQAERAIAALQSALGAEVRS